MRKERGETKASQKSKKDSPQRVETKPKVLSHQKTDRSEVSLRNAESQREDSVNESKMEPI